MNRNIITTALLLTLSACGGSGGSSSSDNQSSNNTTPPQQSAITIQAVYIDACGNETNATDAALLIHNSDYSNKQIVNANVSGEMSYLSDNATETISIVMRGSELVDGVKPIELTTYVDHPVIDMGVIYINTNDKSQCSCEVVDLRVNVPARPNDLGSPYIDGEEQFQDVYGAQGYAQYTGIERCSSPGTSKSPLSVHVDYFGPEESFANYINETPLPSEIDTVVLGTPASVLSPNANRQISAFIDGEYHFRSYAYDDITNIYSYPFEGIEFYSVDAYSFEDLYGIPNVDSAYLFSLKSENTRNINQTFDLPMVSVDYAELLAILVSDSGEYDFSSSNAFDYMTVSVTASGYAGDILDWYMYAPTSGMVPKIENIDLSQFMSDSEFEARAERLNMSVGARGYQGITSYSDFLQSKVNRKQEDFIQDKWAKSDRVNFRIFMSGVQLSNIANVLSAKSQTTNAASNVLTRAKNDDKSNLPTRLMQQEIESEH